MPLMSFDWQTLRPNFYRRYKWAFRDDFDNFETPLVLEPSLARFVRVCGEALKVISLYIQPLKETLNLTTSLTAVERPHTNGTYRTGALPTGRSSRKSQ